ncbi:TadE/TadG family type IV pilus assembly protein [Demequina capsici]|uniref:TadE/TadG family type IV pilus assembly protein n=1 Tax=Demequina capsici TaxID=3075620 RepID=A0AA96J752_9MICO|nr:MULTISPECIES: TadE/TadG family type IV pilus assembly protein [unclassified Demequina]WNM24837.1 TadE/TadG family type IV pilus assembly protein [Demequina sp. OYTSA14]WNM27744.1 TadE/TadG family type IV pilus assembly protein [Demequina sp. PMTSA13]
MTAPSHGAGPRRLGDRGSAAVELAAAMPAVVLLLGAVVSAGVWGAKQIAAQQAAGAAARAVVVDAAGQAEIAARDAVGPGVTVSVSQVGSRATVTVTVPCGGWLPDATAVVVVPDAP